MLKLPIPQTPLLVLCFACLVLGAVLGIWTGKTFGWFQKDPMAANPPRTVFVDREPTADELDVPSATPETITIFAPVRETVRECIKIPPGLASTPHVSAETAVNTSGFPPDSSRSIPFTVLPTQGGVSSPGGADVVVRHYDPETLRWSFDTYHREPANAWFGTTGGGVVERQGFGFAGLGRRQGRFEVWVAPVTTGINDAGFGPKGIIDGVVGALNVRF